MQAISLCLPLLEVIVINVCLHHDALHGDDDDHGHGIRDVQNMSSDSV